MKRKHKPEERDTCPCCKKDMKKGAMICGFCFLDLPRQTQAALQVSGPARHKAITRFMQAVAQGKRPKEIVL